MDRRRLHIRGQQTLPPYWAAPSTWAPQHEAPYFSRAMDWAVLATIEGQADVASTALQFGVTKAQVHERAEQLRSVVDTGHARFGAGTMRY